MLTRIANRIKKFREDMRPDEVTSPTFIKINDWIDLKAETDKKGNGHLYVIATCLHKSNTPPIKAVRMKLHKLASEQMPYFELMHIDSQVIDEVEAYMLGHEVNNDSSKIRMVHTFEFVTYPEKSKK